MSIGEVKATLRAGVEAARQGRRGFDQAVDEARSAAELALALLHDSRHDDVQRTRAALAAAEKEVEPTRRRYDGAIDNAGNYLSRLG